MKAKITYEGLQRIERYFVPDAALREALLNALCHKKYESCIPIQVSVYEDHLYIANCGRLPENWTVDNLLSKHISKPYNPTIANVYYLAGFIESWGRGIEKICTVCREGHYPLPEYYVNPEDIMIKFRAPINQAVRTSESKIPEQLSGKISGKISEKEMKVLQLLREDPARTSQKIADLLSVSRKTVSTRLRGLKEKKIIERVGSDIKGYWKINING